MITSRQEAKVGDQHAPTSDTSAKYNHDSQVYINDPCEPQQLKNDPLIQFFANVDPEIYKLVASTNPTLKMAFDLAKRVVEAEG